MELIHLVHSAFSAATYPVASAWDLQADSRTCELETYNGPLENGL